MTLPTIFGGRTSAIVDEEMGQAPAFVDGNTAPAAASQQPGQPGHLAGGVQAGTERLVPSNVSVPTTTAPLPSHIVQETMPVATEPPSAEVGYAVHSVTRRKRNRGSDPEDTEPHGAGPSQIQAAPQTGERDDTIEEVDEYGIRTKVRLTVNEAESRQRIQERDEVVAQRDAIARERNALMEKVAEMEAALASASAQRVSLDQSLSQANERLAQADQVAARYDAEVNKIKAEADKHVAFFQAQAADFKSRLASTAANHSRIMKEWEARRERQQKEASDQHQRLRNELETVKDQLNEALSQMQRFREQSEAQVQENERLKKLYVEIQSTNVAPDHQVGRTPVEPQPGLQTAPFVDQQATGRPISIGPPQGQPGGQQPSPFGHTLQRSPQSSRTLPACPPQADPRATVPPPNHVPGGSPQTGTSTSRLIVIGPTPNHRQTGNQATTSNGHLPRTNLQPTGMLPSPLQLAEDRAATPLLASPSIRNLPSGDRARPIPTITSPAPMNQRAANHPLNPLPSVHPSPERMAPLVPSGGYNQHGLSPSHTPRLRQSEMSNLTRTIPANLPPRLPSPDPTNEQDDRMEDTPHAGSDGDTESDAPELPDLVDRKAMKTRRKNQIAPKGPFLQRQGQRRVEVIAPPATYPRSRISQAMLGRLHLPSPSPNPGGNPVIHRSLFDPARASGHPLPSTHVTSNAYTTSPVTPMRQSSDQRQPRERSPPINPPGSIFGRHNLSPRRTDEPTYAPRQQSSPTRPTNGRGGHSQGPRYTPLPASGSSHPLKETSPREDFPAQGNTANSNVTAEGIAASLASTIQELIAAQMAAYTQELRSQGIQPRASPRTPRTKGNKHHPFRTPARLRPRTQMRQDLMDTARPEIQRLLEIEEDDDIVHTVSRHVVSLKKLEEFTAGIAFPELDPLLIDWDDPKSTWNQELATMFQVSFIEAHPEYRGHEEELEDYFIQRINTLRKRLKELMVRDGEDMQAATTRVAMQYQQEGRAKRKRTRRKKHSDDRLETCRQAAEQDPTSGYGELYCVIHAYGPDGMSSDDTDGETYSVRRVPWRPPEMDNIMDHLDDLRDRLGVYGNRRPGGLPRPRVRRVTQAISERNAPATLPRNLYWQAWLNGLSQFQLSRLAPGEEIPLPVLD